MSKVMIQSPSDLKQDFHYKLSNLGECIFKTICRKRSLLVLLLLRENKVLRYKQISKSLGEISPSTLSEILKKLRREGLIIRKSYGEIPPIAVEYSLTKNGISLLQAIDPYLEWLRKT